MATKLDEWQAAGLIDGAAASAIRSHEDGAHRPIALFAVAGLGLLALALGILSLVAANWDELPAGLKLSVHIALTAIAAVTAVLCARRDWVWAGEGALFLLAALTLAGIALQSQVYQLTGALWQALAWWAILVSPVILLLGRTRLVAYGYGAMLAALAVAYGTAEFERLGEALAMALPTALVLAALALPDEERNAAFRAGLFEFGFAATLFAGTLAHIGWSSKVSGAEAWRMLTQLPIAAAVVAGVCLLAFRSRPHADASVIAAALIGSLLAGLFALGIPHGGGPTPRFVGVLSYLVFWGVLAMLATRAGWHRLFRVAIAALAVRLFAVYFELFYSLAFTGVGLIIGGALLIALAWVWTRIVRREAR
ncbi:DUF2157 domain-containing protein [uncultured Sphingomonas sp.]|uniref:DUF2157 domain-containing protein n=1 Tax=uncultured Sphingomonas sp. TaxID=158754 RepID=UPI0035CB7AB9